MEKKAEFNKKITYITLIGYIFFRVGSRILFEDPEVIFRSDENASQILIASLFLMYAKWR
jgi:hypothetical protein